MVFAIHPHESAMGVHVFPILTLRPHLISEGHPNAPALSTLPHASNLDCWSISHMLIYMFQCYSLFYFFFWSFFFFHLFLLVGGYVRYNIVVVFVIHWHESTMDFRVFPIPIPSPTSLSTRSLWVFPVHQAWALVSCIQPGLVICFTLDNTHVLMLFSQNVPPSPSPTESKGLFCTSVSLSLFCI